MGPSPEETARRALAESFRPTYQGGPLIFFGPQPTLPPVRQMSPLEQIFIVPFLFGRRPFSERR